ncbi:MAG: hypothetical protein IPP45_19605 [Sphingomonadales bacterium]|nr:hypothetical protein [Sphingomonadales bacterium]
MGKTENASLDAEIKSSNQLARFMVDEEGMPARYWIPTYQRYRWTETQVVRLLDDIWDFIQNCGAEGVRVLSQLAATSRHQSGPIKL